LYDATFYLTIIGNCAHHSLNEINVSYRFGRRKWQPEFAVGEAVRFPWEANSLPYRSTSNAWRSKSVGFIDWSDEMATLLTGRTHICDAPRQQEIER
jgi:hypothetical protein